MENQELLATVLFDLGQVVGLEVAADPDSWSRALFWLYNKIEELDWTVHFLLKPVWGEHFKNEVPGSLFAVCDLPEQVGTLNYSALSPNTQITTVLQESVVSKETLIIYGLELQLNVTNFTVLHRTTTKQESFIE